MWLGTSVLSGNFWLPHRTRLLCADVLVSPSDDAVSAYLEVLVPAVKRLPDVARAMVARVAASDAETQAAKKDQEEQGIRLENAESDNSRLQQQLSGLLARCDQDLQQVREETQAAQALAHDQIAELLVRLHACTCSTTIVLWHIPDTP